MSEDRPIKSDKQTLSQNGERRAWLAENAEAFKARSEWHKKHGHPLKDIMVGPLADTWRD